MGDTDPGLHLLFDAHHLWIDVVTAFEDDDAYDVEQMHFDRSEHEERVWREIGFHVTYTRFCVLKELAEIPMALFDDAGAPVLATAQARRHPAQGGASPFSPVPGSACSF